MSVAKKVIGGCATIIIFLIGAIVLWTWVSFPTVSYRYRLTVTVESDDQVYTGSSVIEVGCRFNPQSLWPITGMYNLTKVKGQAAVIDLDARGVLVAVAAAFLAGRAFQPSASQSGGGYGATLDRVRERHSGSLGRQHAAFYLVLRQS